MADKNRSNLVEPTASKYHRSQPIPSDMQGVEGIDKVRDILFGAKIKEQNESFEAFQQKIESRLMKLREEHVERFGILEKYTKEELNALTHSLENEKNERDKSFANLNKIIDALRKDLVEKLGGITTDQTQSAREIRNFILSCTKDLSEKIHADQQRLVKEIDRDIKSLNDRKINRLQIAEFLNEWSARISDHKEEKLSQPNA